MDLTVTILRVALATVFAVAAVGKLADPAGGRRAFIGVGVPSRVAGLAATALPVVELGVATLLIAGPGRAAALAAVALVGMFNLGLLSRLLKGDTGGCHCFGRIHDAPLSWWTLGRNALLTGVGAFLLSAAPGPAPAAAAAANLAHSSSILCLGGLAAITAAALVRLSPRR
jgi:hypothetical protein